MKKLFSVLAVLFVLGTTSVFAKGKTAIGAQTGYPLGAAVTFKVQSVPAVFAADLKINNAVLAVGVTADWWTANPRIEGQWGYFYGVGVYGGCVLGNNLTFGVGPRALVGTNFFVLDRALELYLQAAWQPTFWISDGAGFDWANFPINAGFRFWF